MSRRFDGNVRRMVTALMQLLVTVADRKSCGWAGSTVIPASPLRGLRSVRRTVTLINKNTVTIMPASGVGILLIGKTKMSASRL